MANPALIDELEKQFRDNPRRVFARLANEYRKAGDFMRAIEICHAHVPQQPGYISGHIVLGQALYDAGELDQAQQTFQAALSLDPENLIALRQLGDIARNRRDYREARSWYTRLLEVDPQNEEIVAQLGELALVDVPGSRNGGADHAETRVAVVEEHDVATAVAEVAEPEQNDTTDFVAGFEPMREDIDAGVDDETPPRVAERLTIETNADSVTSADTGAGDADPEPLVLDDTVDFRGEPAEAMAASRASVDEPSDAGTDVQEEDVAWIAADEANGTEEAFIIDEVTEIDATEVVIASDPRESRESLELDDHFDFTFEPEEYEAPLRPHTGESLSVIAEEDALAGVHSTHRSEPSPFDTPSRPSGEDDVEEALADFEALPIEEIDAASRAAGEAPAAEGQPLRDEMSDWASAADAPPASSGTRDDEGRAEALELSDAETLIEETSVEIAWSEPAARNDPAATVESAGDVDDFGWELHPAATDTTEVEGPVAEPVPEPVLERRAVEADEAAEVPAVEEVETPAQAPASGEAPEPARASVERDAAAEKATAAAPDESPQVGAFVTETMAELYLKQGFRNEALAVYRKLSQQWPGDEVIRARIAELEQGSVAPTASDESTEPAASAGPTLSRPAASFFRSLASVPVPTPPSVPVPTQPSVPEPVREDTFGAWANEALAEAGEVSAADESAAEALARGFRPEPAAPQVPVSSPATRAAQGAMKLSDIFGASPRTASAGTAGSMDAFFTPEGERAGASEREKEEEREDLEAFNAWLEGLKK